MQATTGRAQCSCTASAWTSREEKKPELLNFELEFYGGWKLLGGDLSRVGVFCLFSFFLP